MSKTLEKNLLLSEPWEAQIIHLFRHVAVQRHDFAAFQSSFLFRLPIILGDIGAVRRGKGKSKRWGEISKEKAIRGHGT